MRILIGHNHYQWAGGEDAVVKTESLLLKNAGHEVHVFEAGNEDLHAMDFFWSRKSYDGLRKALRSFRPDVAHFHNIYFSLTPSVYDACRDEGVPVVQSLHNFRMVCANALFFRDNHVCEDCVTKSPLEGIKHRCYRNSLLASGAVTALTAYHRWQKTWINKVDCFITATPFTRGKYIQAGLPADKIVVKPNVFSPEGAFIKPAGEFVLYVGRLSQEKGVRQLLEAWKQLPDIPLKLMGDGPLSDELRSFARQHGLARVEFLGHVDDRRYNDHMRRAKFVVIPSQCYENFPRIAVEAFAFGLPVLASRLGSLVEIIDEGKTGFLFDAFNAQDLAVKARDLWKMDTAQMSLGVRRIFETVYSPEINVRQLTDIYQTVISRNKDKKDA